MSDRRTPDPKSPRAGGWQPRDLVPARFRGTRPTPETLAPATPAPLRAPATPAPPVEAASRPLRPPREEYTPFVPRTPLPSRRSSAIATSDVGGDVVLAADGASTDMATASMGRMRGRSLAMAGLVVVAGVFLSRVLGLARVSVFSAEFGADQQLDAFGLAFRIPDLLFQLVAAGAIGSALVPVASELIARGEDERARRLISTLGNLMVVVIAPLAALIWLLAPVLVPLVTPGYADKPEAMQTTIFLTQLMLVSPILLAMGAVMAAGLNSLGIFGPSAMAPNVYNLVIIACAVILTPFFGISALAVGVILGSVGHVLTQSRQFMSNHLYEPVMDLHDPAVRETLLLMGPRALGLGATQLVFVVFGMFTSTLDKGDVWLFYLSFTALQIPVGLIGVPLGIILLPPLSRAFSLGQQDRFRGLVDQSLRLLLFVVVPLTGLMIVLAAPTLGLMYGYGKITESSLGIMVPVFIMFLVGLVAHVMISLLAPIFYAGKDTRTPVTAALLAVAVDIGAAVVLFPGFHLLGLAFAIGLGAWAEVIMLVILMERRIGFDLRPLLRHSVSFVGGACVASAAAYMTARFMEQQTGGTASLVGRITELVPAGLVGLAVYLAWGRLFRLPELQAALDMAGSLFRRRGTKPDTDEY